MAAWPKGERESVCVCVCVREMYSGDLTYSGDLNNEQLSRGEICVANLKARLRMVRVWTGF